MTFDPQIFRRDMPENSFSVAAALGMVPGVKTLIKFGHCPSVDITFTDIWEYGGVQPVYVFPDSAGESIQITGGVGDTQQIVIQGLNADPVDGVIGTELTAAISLNGATPVPVPGNWLSVHRAYNDTNTPLTAGVIIDGTVSGNVFAYIGVEDQQTKQACYMVPGDKVGVMSSAISAINGSGSPTGLFASVALTVAEWQKVYRTRLWFGIQREGTSYEASIGSIPGVMPPLSRIKIKAKASAAATDMSAYFSMYLIDKYLVPGY